jgi:hypothetical protein
MENEFDILQEINHNISFLSEELKDRKEDIQSVLFF